MAGFPQMNCIKCGVIFAQAEDTKITHCEWSGSGQIRWDIMKGVCQKCSNPATPQPSDAHCCYPSCTKAGWSYDGSHNKYCVEHYKASCDMCTVPWCRNVINHDSWEVRNKFCALHRCTHMFETEIGSIQCPSQSLPGKSHCASCYMREVFLTSFRFQLAERVGKLASDTICTRM